MIFGMTYAVYAALTLISICSLDFFRPSPELESLDSIGMTFGRNDMKKNDIGRSFWTSIEYFSKTNLISNVRPYVALSIADESAFYISIGIFNDIRFGEVKITPYFGPAFCQQKIGSWNSKQILNFRTGTEISFDIYKNFAVGVGFYHISNAAITGRENSFGVDI